MQWFSVAGQQLHCHHRAVALRVGITPSQFLFTRDLEQQIPFFRTRLLVKPTHLIGGYAQLSFAFNYLGPTGNQRDEVTVIRHVASGSTSVNSSMDS